MAATAEVGRDMALIIVFGRTTSGFGPEGHVATAQITAPGVGSMASCRRLALAKANRFDSVGVAETVAMAAAGATLGEQCPAPRRSFPKTDKILAGRDAGRHTSTNVAEDVAMVAAGDAAYSRIAVAKSPKKCISANRDTELQELWTSAAKVAVAAPTEMEGRGTVSVAFMG